MVQCLRCLLRPKRSGAGTFRGVLIFRLRIRASGSSLVFFLSFPDLFCCCLPAAFANWHGVVVKWRTVAAAQAGLGEDALAIRVAGDTLSLEKRLLKLRGAIVVRGVGIVAASSFPGCCGRDAVVVRNKIISCNWASVGGLKMRLPTRGFVV